MNYNSLFRLYSVEEDFDGDKIYFPLKGEHIVKFNLGSEFLYLNCEEWQSKSFLPYFKKSVAYKFYKEGYEKDDGIEVHDKNGRIFTAYLEEKTEYEWVHPTEDELYQEWACAGEIHNLVEFVPPRIRDRERGVRLTGQEPPNGVQAWRMSLNRILLLKIETLDDFLRLCDKYSATSQTSVDLYHESYGPFSGTPIRVRNLYLEI